MKHAHRLCCYFLAIALCFSVVNALAREAWAAGCWCPGLDVIGLPPCSDCSGQQSRPESRSSAPSQPKAPKGPSTSDIMIDALRAGAAAYQDAHENYQRQQEELYRLEEERWQREQERQQALQRQEAERREAAERQRQQEAAADAQWRNQLDNPFAQNDGDSGNPFATSAAASASTVSRPPTESETSATNDLVRSIQAGLTDLGYEPGPVDGMMGTKTANAIRAFETAERLWGSGEPTENVLASIRLAQQRPKQCPSWLRYRDTDLETQINLLNRKLQVHDENTRSLTSLKGQIQDDASWVSPNMQIIAVGTAVLDGVATAISNIVPFDPNAAQLIKSSKDLQALDDVSKIVDFTHDTFFETVEKWAWGQAAEFSVWLRALRTANDALNDAQQAYRLQEGFPEARATAVNAIVNLDRNLQQIQSSTNRARLDRQAFEAVSKQITGTCGPIGDLTTASRIEGLK